MGLQVTLALRALVQWEVMYMRREVSGNLWASSKVSPTVDRGCAVQKTLF